MEVMAILQPGVETVQVAQMLAVKLNTIYSRLRLSRERFARFVARHRAGDEEAS